MGSRDFWKMTFAEVEASKQQTDDLESFLEEEKGKKGAERG